MANGHGGTRIGAGNKKKPLADKILEGNPGKRKLTVVEFTEILSGIISGITFLGFATIIELLRKIANGIPSDTNSE